MNNSFLNAADNSSEVKFSVIIPAHNEEKYIGACLTAIKSAANQVEGGVEVIVILNRCTDQTEEIAQSFGCITINNDDKNLSAIRNSGAKIARGTILVTIDADSQMPSSMLKEAERMLESGEFIGGGVRINQDRISLGIIVSVLLVTVPLLIRYGAISVGSFWCYKSDFEAIGGFDERILMAEDADFANRLKRYGKATGKKFGTVKEQMMTSSRRFDRNGDWFVIKQPRLLIGYWIGDNRSYADRAYYEDQGR